MYSRSFLPIKIILHICPKLCVTLFVLSEIDKRVEKYYCKVI